MYFNYFERVITLAQVVYPVSKKQEVLQLLEEHITENIVKASCTHCDFHIADQPISSRLDRVTIVRLSAFLRDLFYLLSSVPFFTEISRRNFLVSLKTFTA